MLLNKCASIINQPIINQPIARLLQHYDLLFPLATFIANAISCIILGALIGWSLKHSMSSSAKLLWLTGFCGGFSTFSTFTYETFALVEAGNYTYALANIALSILVCLIGIFIGLYLFK